MRNTLLTIMAAVWVTVAYSQNESENEAHYLDSLENSFHYEQGTILLKGGIATVTVPPGFKYLNAEQAEKVLVEYWGNPWYEDMTFGFLLPDTQGLLSENDYVFNIEYDELGYVKDKDADKINYDDLLKDLQKDDKEGNEEREKDGYDPVYTVGWAAKPFYDKNKKVLYWAKELKFGDQEVNTLNYNIRILGRKGVLILNAIAIMPDLPAVQKDIDKVLDAVQFVDGYKYKDFDPSIDDVAKWTIGGLVAGKVLAKVGFFAVILKFWKVIALAIAGVGGAFWKGKKKKTTEAKEPEESTNQTE